MVIKNCVIIIRDVADLFDHGSLFLRGGEVGSVVGLSVGIDGCIRFRADVRVEETVPAPMIIVNE